MKIILLNVKRSYKRDHTLCVGHIAPIKTNFIVDETNFFNIVKYINTVSRRQIPSHQLFNELEDPVNLLLELISERARSGKPATIALFTTHDKMEKLKDSIQTYSDFLDANRC